MVLCQVQTNIVLIVKVNATDERFYQLRPAIPNLTCYVNFITPPSYIGILVILMYNITFLSEVKCL